MYTRPCRLLPRTYYTRLYYIVDRTDSALFHAAINVSIRATVKTLTIDLNNNNIYIYI